MRRPNHYYIYRRAVVHRFQTLLGNIRGSLGGKLERKRSYISTRQWSYYYYYSYYYFLLIFVMVSNVVPTCLKLSEFAFRCQILETSLRLLFVPHVKLFPS